MGTPGGIVRGLPRGPAVVRPSLTWVSTATAWNATTTGVFSRTPRRSDIILASWSDGAEGRNPVMSCTGFAFTRLASYSSGDFIALFIGKPIPGAASYGTTVTVTDNYSYPCTVAMLFSVDRPEMVTGRVVRGGSYTGALSAAYVSTIPAPSQAVPGKIAIAGLRRDSGGDMIAIGGPAGGRPYLPWRSDAVYVGGLAVQELTDGRPSGACSWTSANSRTAVVGMVVVD